MTNRRSFVAQMAAGIGLLSLPQLVSATNSKAGKKMKVVCVGAHPDDPESGCGGTLALLSKAGHEVTIIYLTRGEAGIEGKSHEEAANIRTKEAVAAAKLLGATPKFLGQIDGATEVTNEWLSKLEQMIREIGPDIVFTHWPIDSHKDHQCASLLAQQCWMRTQKKFDLYFFEVCYGYQTQVFHPTDYIDISTVQQLKHNAIALHDSQDPPSFYKEGCNHGEMESFRGAAIRVKAAEAFIRMPSEGIKGV